MKQNNFFKKICLFIYDVLKKTIKKSIKTIWFMMKIIIPINFLLTLFIYLDILKYIVMPFVPLMNLFGLPGEAALAIVSANLLTPFGALTIAQSIPNFTVKQITVLGIMALISHALIAECAVLKGIGVPFKKSVTIRIVAMILFGIAFNLIIGNHMNEVITSDTIDSNSIAVLSFDSFSVFYTWFKEMFMAFLLKVWNSFKSIAPMILYITLAIEFFKASKLLDKINNILYIFTKPLGISKSSTIPLFIGMLFGITYGASVIFQSYENNEMSKRDVLIVSLFICLSHSVIEDTIYFVSAGANIWFLLVIRIAVTYLVTFLYYQIIIKRKERKILNINSSLEIEKVDLID